MEIALTIPPVPILILQCMHHRLVRCLEQSMTRAGMTAGAFENFLVPTARSDATLYTCHGVPPDGSARARALLRVGDESLDSSGVGWGDDEHLVILTRGSLRLVAPEMA